MADFKFIRDTVHGNIRVDSYLLELLETPELQRLSGIRQLGFSYLVFPGANHTRLEHSLGTCHVAREICKSIGLDPEDAKKVAAVGLLHDVGHGPYSHTLENLFHGKFGFDHAALTQKIITGDYSIIPDCDMSGSQAVNQSRKPIPEILEKYGIRPNSVARLVTGGCEQDGIDLFWRRKTPANYPAHIIHSALDADQIDYLLRDSHYTGVAYGTVDLDRLLQTMAVHNDQLVIHEKGVSAVESLLVARALMYSSVYLHKTVRIAELMLSRSVENAIEEGSANPGDVWRMTDSELMSCLNASGSYGRDIALSLKYRNLFKKAYSKEVDELDDDERKTIAALSDVKKRRKKESELCSRAGIPDGYAIIDVPAPELLLSEPRISKVDVRILTDDGKLKPFSSFSPLSDALRVRVTVKWGVMASAPKKYREKVARVAEKIIFG